MMLHVRWFLGVLAMLCLTLVPVAGAGQLPDGEKAKIEALLEHLGGLNAKFIRNGKPYDARTAVKFLRGKWDARKDKIDSAEGFIAEAATRSSTTGQPYQIHVDGQAPQDCAEYLRARLRGMAK